MYRLPSCAECGPPTWLALGLDQGPSSLLPRGTSFGRSVQPRPPFFRRGRRSDLSARGRVPPIPEVPGRVLAHNSFKRLHIHAVPSSSMPARPSLDTCPDDPRALLRAACLVPYQLSRLVLSPLDLAVVVMFLVQRCPLQPRTGMPVRRPQSSLECGHVLAHRAGFLFRPQGCSIHSLDRKPRSIRTPTTYWWSGSRRPLRRFSIAQSHSFTSARIPGQ